MIDIIEEKKFRNWLESISFVDSAGEVIPPILEDDNSEDPEGDREGENA